MDIKQWFLDNLFSILTAILGGGSLFGWITERNRRKIAERKETSDALQSMQEAYDKFTRDSMLRYEELKDEVDVLKKKLTDVTSKLDETKTKYESLKIAYEKIKNG